MAVAPKAQHQTATSKSVPSVLREDLEEASLRTGPPSDLEEQLKQMHDTKGEDQGSQCSANHWSKAEDLVPRMTFAANKSAGLRQQFGRAGDAGPDGHAPQPQLAGVGAGTERRLSIMFACVVFRLFLL